MSRLDTSGVVEEGGAPPRRRRWWPIGGIAAGTFAALLAILLSPWPGALVIRYVFETDAARVTKRLRAHAPRGVSSISDERYRAGDGDASLDVYFPAGAEQRETRHPTVIWIHGGAWVSGHKEDFAPYYQLIAAQGYAVISLDYSRAPGKTYPTPIHQVNAALAYIQEHAERLHVDTGRIVLAGDSAGAQIASQVTALVTNPTYAGELVVTPALEPAQLRGVVLFCGVYDLRTTIEKAELTPNAFLRWGTATVARAYTGGRERDSAALRQMATLNHVTSAFPPAFLSGGNGDPLTNDQSRPLAAKLQALGVDVTALFYEHEHEPVLGHEYQFDLDSAAGQDALARLLAFLREHTV